MAGTRQPTSVLIANGKKHLTKQEIEERINAEIKPLTDNINPPSYLSVAQKKEFNIISEQLQKLEIMSETDIDALARYIIARGEYIRVNKKLKKKEVFEKIDVYEKYSKIQDRYFRQCRESAMDLGLTITSRCRLCIPKGKDNEKPLNKFSVFEKNNIQ